MDRFARLISRIDDFVWGPFTLILLVGTGIFLTVRLHFLPWRNLGYALKITLSKEARTTREGEGDVSPFAALTTALAATIGTGNIVGVATAMVSGGPGALFWMWLSACFGLSSKFSECMLAIKYREVNEKGEMSGGPMYTMKKAFRNRRLGAWLGWLFALFAVLASFGIGNMTQANSISDALFSSFGFSVSISGIILTVLASIIIVGGIKKISRVSSVVVPLMAVFYVVAGLIVIICNYRNLPEGISMIFKMAFSVQAVGGGLCGSITAAMANAVHYGVARGIFSNEAGMGSAAITSAAAITDSPVRQGYVNMTGTFWDTIVVCTITGLCIASSGALGTTQLETAGRYVLEADTLTVFTVNGKNEEMRESYTVICGDEDVTLEGVGADAGRTVLYPKEKRLGRMTQGEYADAAGNEYIFGENGVYEKRKPVKGAALTILAFQSALGKTGGYLVSIGIVLFAFSTILGWEYQGEKAFEYLLGTHRLNLAYRIVFSAAIYVGATTALDIVWNFSDIANALMAIPNLVSLLALSGVIAKEAKSFQSVIREEKV